MRIENNRLVSEEADGQDFQVQFKASPNVSRKPQADERRLVIHAPGRASVDSAVREFEQRGRNSRHLLLGADGKAIVQMVPFDLGAIHAPGEDGRTIDESSIAIELEYPGELHDRTTPIFNARSRFEEDRYILGSPLNNSRYGNWPLFPKDQLDSLVRIIAALKDQITDVVAVEEIVEEALNPAGPAFPILQLREKLIRENILTTAGRSLVLQEITRDVPLLGQPDKTKERSTLLAQIPAGTPVLVVNERFDWYLIAVMAEIEDDPWLMGWVAKDAVRVSTDFELRVNDRHLLETSDQRRFPRIMPHKNGYQAKPLMDEDNPPRFIIMHYTTGTRMESTINHFKNKDSGVSTHLLIGRDGRVVQFLPFNIIANHSGWSWWEMQSGLNRNSIGIELDNAGRLSKVIEEKREVWKARKITIPEEHVRRAPHWKNEKRRVAWELFPDVQLEVALKIVRALKEKYGTIQEILGHDDVNLLNREDPGPLFPMQRWRMALFGRTSPEIEKFYLRESTNLIFNFNGTPPNERTKLHDPPILPADSEVTLFGKFDPTAIWTKITVKQPKKQPRLKGQKGWVRTNSILFEEMGKGAGNKGGRKPRKDDDQARGNKGGKKQNTKVRIKIKNDQPFFTIGGGQPTPPLPGSPFPAGLRVRRQTEKGKWTLVVVLDRVNGETGFEGWVPTEVLTKRKPASRPALVASGDRLWRHKDDQELGDKAPLRPHKGDPAVFPMHDSRVDLTREWQWFIRAINYKMEPKKVSAIFNFLRAFCNLTGLADPNNPRADFITGENLTSPLPQLDKVRTCARSVMKGRVEGDMLIVEMMDGSKPPPLKPGRVLPDRIEDLDIDIYEFTPRTHPRLFFAANITKKGGKVLSPFPNGGTYDWFLGGQRMVTWMPHVARSGVTVRYPLSRLVELPPGSPLPSPYKTDKK